MDSPRPIYILHLIVNSHDYFTQKTCSMCVNDFVEQAIGHFDNGRFIHDPVELDIVYHRQQWLDGYAPPEILVDLIQWLINTHQWADWMGQFDQIALIVRHADGV